MTLAGCESRATRGVPATPFGADPGPAQTTCDSAHGCMNGSTDRRPSACGNG